MTGRARSRSWPSPVVVLLAGGVVLGLAIGSRQAFGLFLVPMSVDLDWGRETFALAIAIQNLIWGISQPAFGYLSDRLGATRAIVLGTVLYCAGVYLMAKTGGELEFHFSAGVLVGLGLSGTSFAVVLGAVGRAFPPARRSLALGMASAFASIGQFAMLPIGQQLITAYGWSGGLTGFAIILAVMAFFALGCGGRASEAPDGPVSVGPGHVLATAFRNRGYVLLTLGFMVCGFQITFIITHLPAYLGDVGLSAGEAANAVALIGLFNIAGTLLCGVLGQRLPKRHVLAGLYTVRGVVLVAFLLAPASLMGAYVFSAAMGLLWLGTVPLTSALVAQVFGPRYMGTLFGVVFLAHQIGAFLGVWMGGRLYDSMGSYDVVWWLSVALCAVAALLHLPIDERPLAEAAPAR